MRSPIIRANINQSSSELETFFKVFLSSLFLCSYHCAQINIIEKSTGKKITRTDPGEIMVAAGCSLVVCYNCLSEYSF
jgi:hypothetical protein